jgi:putative glycosyltransferase (TIGR04348 family)
MLRDRCKVIVQTRWDGSAAHVLLALHAHRSAESVSRFHDTGGEAPIAVALTGTDLYRDLPGSAAAARSLDLARAIVALQDDAPRALAPRWRRKVQVIYQSAHRLAPRDHKPAGRLACVVVGHLRVEKDPLTLFRAVARLEPSLPVTVRHIGAPLDGALATEARRLEARDPRYRYAGALPHGLARAAMKSAHLLVHPSVMEGGANVIVEAVTAGTEVVASEIPGNVGMLGRGYAGYFDPGDASGLAGRLVQACGNPAYLAGLERQCAARRKLFTPEAEARAIRRLVAGLLA